MSGDDRGRIYYPQCRAVLQVILDGQGSGDEDSDPLAIPIIPKSATVHINSYKQADSWQLVFDAGDLPFDPRLIRAGAVEIYLFQTSGIGDGTQVNSRREPLSEPDAGSVRPRSGGDTTALEQGTDDSRDRFTLGNKPRIVGLFDDDDMELSDSGNWITLRGQDYTAHLMSCQFPPTPSGVARRIPTGKRLDLIVGDLLAEVDPDGQLAVDVRGIVAESLPTVGMEVGGNRRGIPVEQATSYWDVIYKLVTRYGFIAFVDGLDVVISRPKTITDRDTSTIRRLAWGRNLESLSMRRHLGKEQAPTIVVRSYVPGKGTLTAEYPTGQLRRGSVAVTSKGKRPVFKRRTKVSTTKSKLGKVRTTITERDEYQIVTVHGISDLAALQRIAENRYHLLGKSERTVVARTRDLRDLREVEMLDLSAGDACSIEWDPFNRQLLSNPAISAQAKVAHLVARGFNAKVAGTIARYYDVLQGLDRPLRFREGTIEWDADDGVSIEMELQDFMVIDGIRPDTGAPMPSATDRRPTGADGKAIGWSPAYTAAQQKRFG